MNLFEKFTPNIGYGDLSVVEKMALTNPIMVGRVGSLLYGTHTPESDEDFTGIFMPSPEYVVGRKHVEQVLFNTNRSDSGRKNTKEDLDCTMYAMNRWMTLAMNNNPNTLEIFFLPDRCIIEKKEEFNEIVKERDAFISLKVYHSFRGFAASQRKLMMSKKNNDTGRVELVEKFGYDTKFASHNIRLLLECIQLLKEGQITFPLKENKMVLAVKRGEYNVFQFQKESDRLESLCDACYANSKLPHSPDQERIHGLQYRLFMDYWRKEKQL